MLLRLVENEIGKNKNAVKGIISNDACTLNCFKLRVDAKDKGESNTKDTAIIDTYGNKFMIPLYFDMIDSVMPFYRSGLGNI